MEKAQEQSKVTPFLDNYKKIRSKFREPPKPVKIPAKPKPPEPPKTEIDAVAKNGTQGTGRNIDQEFEILIKEAEARGISYYQRLIEHAPAMSRSKKLAIIVVLEEYAIPWEELFGAKDRPAFKSIIRWKVFRALHDEGATLNDIARFCNMDHTSVLYGLRKISSQDLK